MKAEMKILNLLSFLKIILEYLDKSRGLALYMKNIYILKEYLRDTSYLFLIIAWFL
jgi:hypothetical protein